VSGETRGPYSFNLLEEAWLPCLTVDGTQQTLSLRAVLHRAHELRDLVVDAPTQYPPLLRLLLAIVHRAFAGPLNDDEWRALWDHGSIPAGTVDDYLDQYRDRFDLFHERTPFMQVANLAAMRGGTQTVGQLIPHVAAGNNVPLFSGYRDDAPPMLTPAEAARWLLHVHAWDTAGIKTGAVDDPEAAGRNRVYGNPPGYLGELGVVLPVGDTLFRTLVLNLTVGTYEEADRPPWERDPDGPTWTERAPIGPVELYTWQSRRVRLFPETDGDRVVVRHCLVTAGDRMIVRLAATHEPHSRFRRSANQEKQLGVATVWLPVTHDPTRQLWRGLGTMLARAERAKESGEPQYRRPAALRHLGERARLEVLATEVIRVRAVGIEYGNMRAVVNDVYDDEMPMPVALLSERDTDLQTVALRAVEVADAAAGALGGLAADVARAAGASDQARGYADRARARLWATLDGPFRQWLATLTAPGAEAFDRLARWAEFVRQRADAIAEDVLRQAPPSAVRGRREKPTDDKSRILNTGTADLTFRARLRKALAPATAGPEVPAEEGAAV
jgi:CRISPR system Cascade subunit CasA